MLKSVYRGGWLSIIALDGELCKEDDTLINVSPKSDRKKVEKYVVIQ